MALIMWSLVFCILATTLPGGQTTNNHIDTSSNGVLFSIERRAGSPDCASLSCSSDLPPPLGEDKFQLKRITIYDISQGISKLKLASFSQGDSVLYIDPTKKHDINGSAAVSKFRAEINLVLRNPTDCLYSPLQCEIEYITSDGRKQVARQNIAAQTQEVSEDCSCASIVYQFIRLNYRADGTLRQLVGLTYNVDYLQGELVQQRNRSQLVVEDIARVQENHEKLFLDVERLRKDGREIGKCLDDLRHNDTHFEQKLNVLRQNDQENKDDLTSLRLFGINVNKQLADLKSSDETQEEAITALVNFDESAFEDIAELQHVDLGYDRDISYLRNDTDKAKRDVIQLRECDTGFRRDIADLQRNNTAVQVALAGLSQGDHSIRRSLIDLRRTDAYSHSRIAQLENRHTVTNEQLRELRHSDNLQLAEQARLKQVDITLKEQITILQSNDHRQGEGLETLLAKDKNLQKQVDELNQVEEKQEDLVVYLKNNNTETSIHITSLQTADELARRRLETLRHNTDLVSAELRALRVLKSQLSTQVELYSQQISYILNLIDKTKVTTVIRSTTSLVLTNCTKGMPHNQKRVNFLLYGLTPAVCDMEVDDGGWLVIQRRTSSKENFNRDWNDYRQGFGNVNGDFYLGNGLINNLTKEGFSELRIDLVFGGKKYYAQYSSFRVYRETLKYLMTVDGYRGDAGDSFSYHSGSAFSTYDQDHDSSPDNCAQLKKGGWWYNNCAQANLNGQFGVNDGTGIIWETLSKTLCITSVEMKIRYAG